MRVALRDYELHIQERGEGRPLVFVHGLGLSLKWWRSQVPVFAREWRVLALDLPGFGDSSQSRYPDKAIDALITDLEECRQKLNLGPIYATGHSLGGMMLLGYAAKYPASVKAVVVAGACARFGSEVGRKMLEARIAVLEQEGVRGMIEKTFDYTAASHFAPGFVDQRPEVLDFVKRQFEKVDAHAYIQLSRAIMEFDIVDRLGDIQCPTLVLVGEYDNRCPVEDAVVMNTRIGPSWLKVMPGVGHSPMIEDPEAFNAVVARFLEGR